MEVELESVGLLEFSWKMEFERPPSDAMLKNESTVPRSSN